MTFFYSLHSLTRRHLSLLERFFVALGISILLYGLVHSLPVYPLYWDIVLVLAVFALTLWSPLVGYFVAIIVAAYPLYSVSIYVAVLFLAIAIIGQHIFIQNLGGTLLTIASPLLGAIYLPWIIPLLGGLWWGAAGGALMGALGALWGQIAAGMVGLDPDWIRLLGILPDMTYLPQHFATADSLQTLLKLLDPLAPNSTGLLYHLLQVAIWAFAGWLVGMLADKEWMQYRRPKSTVALLALGAPLISLLMILANLWLGTTISTESWAGLGLTTLASAATAAALEAGYDFFDHPLPLPRKINLEIDREEEPASPQPLPVPQGTSSEPDKDSKPDDLIMLELD